MTLGRFRAAWLMLTAAVCGAVVMAVELLGARMLSVGYGGSLAVWAAMISVTLLSLAAGYFAGGFVSDRAPRTSIIFGVTIAAGLLIAACPHLRFVLGACYDSLGIQWGALASSFIVFFLPLGLLGMISPFVISVISRSGRGVGVTAGGVYAISTIGSVAGTLLTGLWLIPSFGIPACFRLVAVAAVSAGAVGLLVFAGRKGVPVLSIPILAALIPEPGLRVGSEYAAPDGERVSVESIRDSRHGCIVVLRKGTYMLLAVDGIVQTGVPVDLAYMQKGRSLIDHYFQELIPYLVEDPGRSNTLIVGLAGGMTASLLKSYGMDLDCVDLDPDIIETAREWFSFTGDAVVADGRRYLEACEARYDFCVVDTYSGDVLPFYLSSVEAFRAARRVLKPGGVLVVNFIGSPAGAPFACIYRTMDEVFENLLALKCEESDDVQTITIFASERAIEFNRGWMNHLTGFTGVDPVTEAIERLRAVPSMRNAVVLSDDYNPIDSLRAAESLRWRQRTVENVGRAVLF